MGGTWPNLDLSDLTARSRTYLNEAVAKFYPDTELYRNLSLGAKKIAQEGSVVRRVLDAVTVNGTRTVATNCYKVMFAEYIPATGRSKMLRKIEPHQVGLKALSGTAPQYWYEFGSTIGIEPLPDAVYNLRLYVADVPMVRVLAATGFSSGWTAGTGWTAAAAYALHGMGAAQGDLTYSTATVAPSTRHIIIFSITGNGPSSVITPYIGTTAGKQVSALGDYVQAITSPSGTPSLIFRATDYMTIDNVYLYKEADFSAVTDQTDIPPMWQHLISLIATSEGLKRDNRNGPAQILEALTAGEIAYLRSNILEIIPTSRNERRAD